MVRGAGRNLGIATDGSVPFKVGAGVLLFSASETAQGTDLNGDADLDDALLQLTDLDSGRTRNVGLDVGLGRVLFDPAQELAVFSVGEAAQGNRDLNGDGDALDFVLHVADVSRDVVRSSGLDSRLMLGAFIANGLPPSDGRYALPVGEADQGGDLNGDGDSDDIVVHAVRLTDRDRDGRFDFADAMRRPSKRIGPR